MGAIMRPLEVPKMKRKELLQRLAEEKKLAMEIGSLYGSSYFYVTHRDGTIEKRIRPEVQKIMLHLCKKIKIGALSIAQRTQWLFAAHLKKGHPR